MPFQLRHIDDLAEETGSKSKAQKLLNDAGVTVVNGFYDHGSLEAMFAEPKSTNVGRQKKNLFTISETDGLGAMKAVLDRVDLDIVRHLYHQTNYLTVRSRRGKRRQVKVYSAARTRTQWQIATFTCTGFLSPQAPSYYLFMCYEGPIAWVMSRRQLTRLHKKCRDNGGWLDYGFSIPKSKLDHKRGVLAMSLGADDEDYLLTSAKKLGL